MHPASETQIRVLYADTDKMGIVYHATYLRWLEAGRGDFMRECAMPYTEIEDQGILLPVVEINIKYIASASYDDILVIKTSISDIRRAQVRFDYEITKGDILLVKGFSRHAAINASGQLTRLPENVVTALQRYPIPSQSTGS